MNYKMISGYDILAGAVFLLLALAIYITYKSYAELEYIRQETYTMMKHLVCN